MGKNGGSPPLLDGISICCPGNPLIFQTPLWFPRTSPFMGGERGLLTF